MRVSAEATAPIAILLTRSVAFDDGRKARVDAVSMRWYEGGVE